MLKREEILEILNEANVLQNGHFILTSGRHSESYMQMAQALQQADITEKLCKSLAEYYDKEKIDLVVSPAIGGIIVGYEMSRHLNAKNIFCERENGKMKLRRGFEIKPNQKVLIVEDVITTGGSVKEVIEVVQQANAEIIGVAALIDRSNGKVNFNYPFKALLPIEINSYKPDKCPLCEAGIPTTKPGSRNINNN